MPLEKTKAKRNTYIGEFIHLIIGITKSKEKRKDKALLNGLFLL